MNLLALTIDWDATMLVVAFGIIMVFIILVLLVFIIQAFGKLFAPRVLVPKVKKGELKNHQVEEMVESHLSADCSAAIGMALHLYYDDIHDLETAIVTIKKVEKRYSPWSSKIYGLTNLVR